MSEKGKFKEKYVTLDDLYWIMEYIPDKRFTREEFDALEDEEYFVPASLVEQAKVEFGKMWDGKHLHNTPMEIHSMYSVHPTTDECENFAVSVITWFKKWFGE